MPDRQPASGFDIMKEISRADGKIYFMALGENLVHAQKTKRGTHITIGTPLDCIMDIEAGRMIGGLILVDKAQWDETKKKLEAQAEEVK